MLVQHYGTTSRDSWSLDSDPFDRYADYQRGDVNTSGVDDAIDDIDGQLNRFASGWKRVAVIFVKAELTRSALATARSAREDGLEIFIIVIGDSPGVDRDELRSLVSVPTSTHFLVASDASRLRDHANAVLQTVRGLDGGSTCASFGFGHFATMDGKSYTFNGHGEFWLSRSLYDSYSAQIRQVRCPWSEAPENHVCARAVAITDGSERVGVYYDSRAKLLEVRVNGQPLPKRSQQETDGFSVQVSPLNGVSGGYSFRVASLTRGHAVSGYFARDGSAIFYTPDGGAFLGTEGLCGRFNGCSDDDFAVQGEDHIDTNAGKFGESWRVARAESIFDILPNERFDAPEWEAVNSLDEDVVEDGESTSDGQCAHVAAGVLRRSCQYDAEMGDDAAYTYATRQVDFFNCALLCETGLLPVPVAKATYCGCANTDFDLHLKYGSRDENDELIEPPHNLIFADGPRAFLRGALQGTYGIQLKASSCSADEITVTRKVGCVGGDDGQLDLNAGSNKEVKYVDGYGYPTVTMDAVVLNADGDEMSAGSLVGVSWNFSAVPEEIVSAEQLPVLFGSNTLRPQWTPTLPGSYKLEVAVYDGCQIVRKTVKVEVECAACVQEVVVDGAVPTIEFDTDDGSFGSVTARAKAVPGFSFSYTWSVKADADSGLQASVDPEDENVWIIYTPSVQLGEAEITAIESRSYVVYDDDVTNSPISAIGREYLTVYDAGLVNRSLSQCNATRYENVTMWDPSPRVQERCRLTFSSATSRTPTISVEESPDFGFDPWTNTVGCTGDYTIVMTAEDSCNTKVDEFVLTVSCSQPPVPVLGCSHEHPENVTHVPGGIGFASVDFNGENTFDPDLADPDSLEFQWYYEAGQDETVPESTFTCTDGAACRFVEFTPAAAGTYEVILSVSDGCQSRNTSQTLEVFCADVEPTIDISVTGTDPSFTMTVDASSGAGVVTSFEIEAPASRQVLVDFGIISDFPQPTDASVDTTFLDYEGDYVITGVAFDGCARATESVTVTRACSGANPMDASFTASPSVSGGVVEISWDETAEAYEDVWFNASLVPAGGTAHWLMTEVETNVTTRVSTLTNYFFPTSSYGEGEYRMDLVVEDGCRSFTANFDIVIGEALSGSSVAECVSTSTIVMAAGDDQETAFANGKFAEVSLSGSTPNSTFVSLITEYHWRFVESPVGSVYQAPTWSYGSVSFDAEIFIDETFPGGEGINETVLVNTTQQGACDNSWVSFAFLEEPSSSAIAREFFPACFTPDLGGTYQLQLVGYSAGCIIDGGTLTVTATCNAAPTLEVSAPSVNAAKGGFTRAVLDASGTTDADNETLTFRWEQVSAPKGSALFDEFVFYQEATAANFSRCLPADEDETLCINSTIAALPTRILTNPSASVASFVPDAAGDWEFKVTVTDGCSVVTETVTVDVGCSGGSSKLKVNGESQVIIEDTLGAEALELIASDECASEYEWSVVSFDDAAPALSTGDALTAGAIAGIVIGSVICLIICIVAIVMAAKKGIIGRK